MFASVAGCGVSQEEGRKLPSHYDDSLTDDRAVLEVALCDFAAWKGPTFGELEGVLALDPLSAEPIYRTLSDTRQIIEPISDLVSDELILAFLERNAVRSDATSLVSGTPWARIYTAGEESRLNGILLDGAKALGSISMPGFNAGRSRALVQFNHSWSIHRAVVTFALSKQDGTWKIQGRYQTVFL